MPEPLIVLCTMRSYSSLVSTMLGQHPDLYGLPELNLFVADSVDGVIRYYRRRNRPYGLHGLVRTIAELEFGGQTDTSAAEAAAWIAQRRNWSSARMFEHIAELAAPRRLVEKSPITSKEPQFLRRLYRLLPHAAYLHLVRHPRAVGNSIVRLLRDNDPHRDGGPLADVVDPERIWQRTNQHASEFLDRLPLGQGMRLQGEMLLGEPTRYLTQIAEWLGVRSDAEAIAAMQRPERSPFARLGPARAELGNDPNFLEHPEFHRRPIPDQSLEGELEWMGPRGGGRFSPATLKLARMFGYE